MKKFLKSSGLIALLSLSLFFSNNTYLNAAVSDSKPTPKPSLDPNKLRINSDEAKYDRKNKIALANGHVKITQDNMTIFTSSVLYNEGISTSFIDQFVRIINVDKETNRKTDISANKMIVYHQEKKVHLEDKVRFDREEERKVTLTEPKANATDREKSESAIRRERSVITSNNVDYWTKSGDAIFTGNAVFLQKEKKASGDSITVKNDANKNTDTITIDKNAQIIQIKGDWLVNNDIVDPKQDKEKERLVKEQLQMNANNIVIYQKTSDLIGRGNVKIVQNVANKRREATGDQSVYSDVNKTMTLTGNVRIKRENEDWLSAEKAVFHTDSENFEAFSTDPAKPQTGPKKQVESEFTIPDEEKPTPEPPIGTPGPDFNLDETNKSTQYSNPSQQPSAKPVAPSPSRIQPFVPSPTRTPVPKSTPVVRKTPVPVRTVPNNQPNNPYQTSAPQRTVTPTQQPTPTKIPNNGEFSFPTDDNK